MDPALVDVFRVYPPLGIARVGNAPGPEDYVIGPEVMGGPPILPSGDPARYANDFRSSDGRIKRQAARFRVYAHMKDGTVAEVTAAEARIEWHVSIANLKAGWYEFNQAMDLPDGLSQDAMQRNSDLIVHRSNLDIVPTPQTIEGRNHGAVEFGDGVFWHRQVYLGELRTDADGRLIFLGGRGSSAPFRKGMSPLTFANNVGWHDDIADGPIRATVTFPGVLPIEAEAGYVAVTPPNFAPGLFGLVTMDDAVRETFQHEKWIPTPASTSFTQDIWPIFDRLTGLQWVNHGLFIVSGHGSPLDARDPSAIGRLRDASSGNAAWRQTVFSLFRDPGAGGNLLQAKLPQIFGDGVDTLPPSPPPAHALGLLSVTPTQYLHLHRWAAGSFADDWPNAIPVPPLFSALSAAEQITHLERAALHDCLGGPFHPGIEITWIMRLNSIWSGAYRLKIIAGDEPARQDYGPALSPAVCIGAGGPYDGVAPGALTRFMGVPWQTDGASCNSDGDYSPSTFLTMPTFWGARVPDQVLAVANYDRAAALDPQTSAVQVQKHFMSRVDWLRDVRDVDYYGRIARMVGEWWELGMVLPVEKPPAHLPADIRVEQGRHPRAAGSDLKIDLVEAVESLARPGPPPTHLLGKTAAAAPVPPKRTFRQGEI
jgi:L-Lysine epsilon oxidase N-terminal/L-lysine epsilon oxidase C-terminal domain